MTKDLLKEKKTILPILFLLPIVFLVWIISSCGEKDGIKVPDSTGAGDGDSDGDGDGDSDGDGDGDTDGDNDAGTVYNDAGEEIDSYIWIANTDESTLSKVNTITAKEEARYRTCPLDVCDPSRTSVNMYGDAVVTNRSPSSGMSSVTKFASLHTDCVDRNENGIIDTSTGPDDVKKWGEDECMIWNQKIGANMGARATAWDGTTNSKTGKGGSVWIGTCIYSEAKPLSKKNVIYKLNGDNGKIEKEIKLDFDTECAYGAAIDSSGGYWIMEGFGYPNSLLRLNMEKGTFEKHPLSCGYGISVDATGRVWTGGKSFHTDNMNCVARYSPATKSEQFVDIKEASWLRGIAIGLEKSAGYAWAVDTNGILFKVDQETLKVVDSYSIGAKETVGVAIDFEGYVWTVSRQENAIYKFDPDTKVFIKVPVGKNPYTYSDMTGMQLKQAINIE